MHEIRQAPEASHRPRRVGRRMKLATVTTGHPAQTARHTLPWPEDDVDELLAVDDPLDVIDGEDDDVSE